ncbi:unnamed protein product [Cuscuta campestris]|uniref:Uncharacterized protein n=1 Tax=Cuscuta campestris TaxID=132261 RepID=A0A484MWC7_9ASTE|nr:unnamed protein product [Cuscuta campestris]
MQVAFLCFFPDVGTPTQSFLCSIGVAKLGSKLYKVIHHKMRAEQLSGKLMRRKTNVKGTMPGHDMQV